MRDGIQIGSGFMIGVLIGAAAGFLWSNSAKSKVADNTTTTIDGESVTVRVNYKKAALQGLVDIFSQ